MIKQCKDCKQYLDTSDFYANVRAKDKLECRCKQCHAADSKARYEANKDKILARNKQYRENNRSSIKESKLKNKHKYLAWARLRQLNKLNATPKWLSADDKWLVQEIYHLAKIRTELTGIKWNVDHIIPIKGKDVCGLHIPDNLQVITELENKSKSNKNIGTYT
jgi:hypothetical protein